MLDIIWTGKSYTDQIDNLDESFQAVYDYVEKHNIDLGEVYSQYLDDCSEGFGAFSFDIWNEIESEFEKVAFKSWMKVPDNWHLTCKK